MAIWLVLLLALVLPRANRNWRVLLILVPLVIVQLLFAAFTYLTGMDSSSTAAFCTLSQSMVVATAVWWLLLPSIQGHPWQGRFLLSCIILAGVASLGVPAFSTEWSEQVAFLQGAFVVFSASLTLAVLIAARFVRHRYRPVAMSLWMAVLTMLLGILGIVVLFVVMLLGEQSQPNLIEMLTVIMLGGSFFGAWVYAHLLPFLILSFTTDFFGQRFKDFLRLQSPAA